MANPKRPRDPNQLAKMMVDIASGEASEPKETVFKTRATKAGLRGGAARANRLSPEQREEIARLAAEARWKKG